MTEEKKLDFSTPTLSAGIIKEKVCKTGEHRLRCLMITLFAKNIIEIDIYIRFQSDCKVVLYLSVYFQSIKGTIYVK